MKQFVTKVTVTGADDRTSIPALIALHEKYPFMETGILLSRTSMGNTRFPSAKWLKEATELMGNKGYNLSGHFCGAWVKEILMGIWPEEELNAIHPGLLSGSMFSRFQINTHGKKHKYDKVWFSQILDGLQSGDQSVIFQYDNANCEVVDKMVEAGFFNVTALFDLSHGGGVLPKEWPAPLAIPCGYAGGLSMHNVRGQLEKLETIVGDSTIWIDAETHLRSQYYNNDAGDQGFTVDYFDLEKVERFLREAEPFVVTAC